MSFKFVHKIQDTAKNLLTDLFSETLLSGPPCFSSSTALFPSG